VDMVIGKFTNLKIQAKLMVAFIIILMITIIVSLMSVRTTSKLNRSVDAMMANEVKQTDLANTIQKISIEAHNTDQQYMLEFKTLGFAAARTQLVTKVEDKVRKIKAAITELRGFNQDETSQSLLDQAAANTENFRKSFLETVGNIEKRGFKDEGLEGEFRKKVHSIEAAVDAIHNDHLAVDMLMIRRHEKDYLLRGEHQYVTKVSEAVDKLKADVDAARLERSKTEEIDQLADDYLKIFRQLVTLDLLVADSIEQYRDAISSMGPLVEKVIDQTQNQQAARLAAMRSEATFSTIETEAIAAAAVVAGLIIALFLARSIARPIAAITRVVDNMARGSLSETLDHRSDDEIGQLTASMLMMQKHLRTIIQSEIQELIKLAGEGNLSNRINLNGKSGFYLDLGKSINDLLAVNEQFLNDTAIVVSALAQGDLNTMVEREYMGTFAKVQQDIRGMRQNFIQVISKDVQAIVQAAAHGDLNGRIDLQGKAGFYRELSAGINSLVQTNADIINDCLRVSGALARGSFEEKFSNRYQGSFAQLQEYVEVLKQNLHQAIEQDIQSLVKAAANGDLKQRIDVSNKQGFYSTLSMSINELVDTSDRIITDTSRVVSGLAQGDLTQTITNEYKGTFNQLKADINLTVQELIKTVKNIQSAAESVECGASEISSGNSNLSQRTEEQAASLEETSAAMEELTTTVQQTAENSSKATQLSKDSIRIADQGGKIVDEAIRSMELIEGSSRQITDIVSVIDEIAFQTNLLALNASVEAARAGMQGKGFAVVADEVRVLAGRCAKAAKEIKGLISTSNINVRNGSELAIKSGAALQEIIGAVKKVNIIVGEISSACDEQSTGLNEIHAAVSQMDNTTQQNAALVEEAAAASESLSQQSRELNALVGFFRIDESRQAAIARNNPAAKNVLKLRSNAR
jgi:methyl-accepting chemotaxis protein